MSMIVLVRYLLERGEESVPDSGILLRVLGGRPQLQAIELNKK
jgi:hypothetical protein